VLEARKPLTLRSTIGFDEGDHGAADARTCCHNAAQLWRELVARGFSGRPGTVRQWAGRRRKDEPRAARTPAIHAVGGGSLSAGQIANQLMTHETLPDADQNFVACLLKQMPELAECVAAAKRLAAVLCKKS
jgi:hypothetical protein